MALREPADFPPLHAKVVRYCTKRIFDVAGMTHAMLVAQLEAEMEVAAPR